MASLMGTYHDAGWGIGSLRAPLTKSSTQVADGCSRLD